MMVSGKQVKSMVMGFINGQMEADIKVSILKAKKMEKVKWFIQMVKHTMENGNKEINMEKVQLTPKKGISMVYGEMEI